ncbi:MAG TPA: ABC transporter substrate-binding protein [Acidimicrobiales bacterium]|nr:ABC transporter substrate-binding protein [Acidimicrobiales bacterium]
MRQRSRWLRLFAVLLGLSMLAAACGDDDDTEASDDTAGEEESGGEETNVATEVGEAAPDCEGTEDGTLTIGALLPETGDLAFLGPPEIAGAQLAVSEINAAGGVNGAPVNYLPGDSGDESPDVANQTVDRHLSAGADAILGAAASGITRNVIDKITGECVIQFSPANTAKDLTTYADGDLYFRTAPSDILQGRVLADLAIEDGISTAAILARGDAYGEGLLEDVKGPFEEQGGEVVVERVYDPEAGNFEAEVDAVVSEDPDALFMIGFEESAGILNALFEQGFTADEKQIYLVDGNVGNSLGANFTEQGVLTGVKGTLPAVELQADFKAKLDATYPGLEDYSYGPETYDAVTILALAAQAAGTDNPAEVAAKINGVTRDGEKCTTFADCKTLLDAGSDIDYDGPSGPQSFSKAGEPTEASFAVQSYGDDNKIDTAATVYKTAKL